VIFIYAAFFREFNMFKKIFRFLLIVAVFIGVVAFLQETWSIFFRYALEKGMTDSGLLGSIISKLSPYAVKGGGRIGIYRVTSLLSHYNLLGLYSLLIITIYLNIAKKINYIIVLSLLSGIFTSVSRTAYMGFIILSGVQIFKGKRWLIIFLIPIVIGLFFMSSLDDSPMITLLLTGNMPDIRQ
jgi:hypothetical protein